MTRSDLVKAVTVALATSDKTNKLTREDVDAVIGAMFSTIKDAIVAGEKVILSSIGTISAVDRKERSGFNPLTKTNMVIPAGKRVVFNVSGSLKESLKGK